MPDRELSAAAPLHVKIVRFFENRSWLFDTVFKVLPLLLMALMIWVLSGTTTGFFGVRLSPPVMLFFELMCILPLAIGRRRPALAAGIIAAGALCQVFSLYGPGVSVFAVPLAVYACAKYGSTRVSVVYLVIALIGAVLVGVHQLIAVWIYWGAPQSYYSPGTALFISTLSIGFSAAVVLVAWLFGDLAGRRRREREAIAEKNRLLERERDQEARLAADAERMRIAREMHDVISHSMSAMIAQADGGRYVMDQDPSRAGRAFESIGETGREALTELRRMLGVLREEGELKTRPSPGVEDLPQLAQDVRASGLPVELNIAEDHLPPLTEGAALAVYRIIQEALTNTLKHGGDGATATVWLGIDYSTRELVAEIRDTGQGAAAENDGAGSGLRGMAERARLYGGTLLARPKRHESLTSGFVVEARFPLDRVRTSGKETPV